MNLEAGSIAGDYQILGPLGAGGMGKVFKVRNTISDRIEAMKVLLPDLAGEPDLADRFLREIKVLAALEHPNIAGLRTALRMDNQLLMVMEFVEGVTLDQRLQQGPLPVAEAANCIRQILAALSYAHKRGVVHRDIKPANMMLMADGTVKLMDFGIAKAANDRKLTMTGTTMGSLYYMSPEQIRGEQTLDARSDLYSVGVSFYELVTGKRPFDGDSQFAIMSAHLEKTPAPPIQIDPRLPQALNDLILFSVNREPGTRFQSADAFGKALEGVMAPPRAAAVLPTEPLAAAPKPAPKPPVQAPVPAQAVKSPNRALWATVGALCCVGLLVGLIQFGPWRKAAADSPRPQRQAENPAVAPPPAQPSTGSAAVESTPPAQTPPAQTPPVQTPVQTPAKQMQARTAPPPMVHASGSQSPAAQLPAVQNAQAPVPVPQSAAPVNAAPTQQQQQAPAAPNRAELQKLRVTLVTVSARASSVHSMLDNIRTQQAASGLGMRSDWVNAASLMDTFLQGANDALNAGDPAAAQEFLDKAESSLARLEKALNK